MKFYIYAFALLCTICSFSLFTRKHPDTKKTVKAETEKIVFKSTDVGKTWQDISKGLPQHLQNDGVEGKSIFANDKGLFLKDGNGLYHSSPNAATSFWSKEILTKENTSADPGKSGIADSKYWGVNVKKTDGTSIWSPMFDISEEPRVRSAFETAGGAIFIGTNSGFFKTTDDGKTWKHVNSGNYAGHLAESNGVLVAASMKKLIRSTDNGETWESTTSKDGVAFDVKPIKDGFVAITASSEKAARRLSISNDGGKTWQPVNYGPQNRDFADSIWKNWDNRPNTQAFGISITQIGEYLFSIHRKGIFRSSDNGKTWKFLLPAIKDKVFNLFISGNVIYAVTTKGGC